MLATETLGRGWDAATVVRCRCMPTPPSRRAWRSRARSPLPLPSLSPFFSPLFLLSSHFFFFLLFFLFFLLLPALRCFVSIALLPKPSSVQINPSNNPFASPLTVRWKLLDRRSSHTSLLHHVITLSPIHPRAGGGVGDEREAADWTIEHVAPAALSAKG